MLNWQQKWFEGEFLREEGHCFLLNLNTQWISNGLLRNWWMQQMDSMSYRENTGNKEMHVQVHQ